MIELRLEDYTSISYFLIACGGVKLQTLRHYPNTYGTYCYLILLHKVQNILLMWVHTIICNIHMEAPHAWTAARCTHFSFLTMLFNKKSCEHDTKMGVGEREKGEERKTRGRETALCVPQRSINTLKALNPKSITITPSSGQRICLLLFHKTTNHWKQ